MKTIKLSILVILLSTLSVFAKDTNTVTKKNCLKLLDGTRQEKLAALSFVSEETFDKAKDKIREMLKNESSDEEVYIQVILAAGKIQQKKCTKSIMDIYKNSTKSAIRFSCILSLLDMQDISSLRFVKKAYEDESDPHTKQVLKKVVDALNKD